MSTLLNELSRPTKQAYQSYTLEHGIERIAVQVPLGEASLFEANFNQALKDGATDKSRLLDILKQLGASIL
jgi:hypothetical protein